MAAGLVDRVQATIFPVITGQTGGTRSSRTPPTSTSSSSNTETLDGHTQELIYRPTLHT